VADVDMLRDRFWVQAQNLLGQRIIFPQNDNGSWLLNLLEVSSDNILLLGLRGRGHTSRPFTRFQKLQQEANLLFLDKEQQLQKKINEAEQQLQQLDNEAQNAPEANSQENQKNRDELIQQFTQNLVDTRQQLRQVRFQLRENQERLESLIVFFNIGFLPLLVLMCAAIVAWIRKYKAPGVSKRPAAS
jgi:vacuolar-type H+-ATPase subunit I/STV1